MGQGAVITMHCITMLYGQFIYNNTASRGEIEVSLMVG